MLKKDITARTLKEVRYRNARIPLASALAIVVAFTSPGLSTAAYALVDVVESNVVSGPEEARRAIGNEPACMVYPLKSVRGTSHQIRRLIAVNTKG